jgi:hypothetical protein
MSRLYHDAHPAPQVQSEHFAGRVDEALHRALLREFER